MKMNAIPLSGKNDEGQVVIVLYKEERLSNASINRVERGGGLGDPSGYIW